MNELIQILAVLGGLSGWGAIWVSHRRVRSRLNLEVQALRREAERNRSALASLEAQLEAARSQYRHQLRQARLSVEIEHALAEQISVLGGGAAGKSLTQARRKAQEALRFSILRDRQATTRAAIEGRLARFDLKAEQPDSAEDVSTAAA